MEPSIELLRVVAHDLKAPISAVLGYAELVQMAGELNEQQKTFLTRIMSGMQHMESLVAHLENMAWIDESTQLTLFDIDLRVIITEAVDLLGALASRRGIAIDVQVEENLPIVAGDARLLMQVMSNLLTNAIKYNNENGKVWIRAIRIDDSVQVTIQDNGLGIPEIDLPHVFERYYRSQSGVQRGIEGSGIGLSIVQIIIHKHNGTIKVDSKVGEGTTFVFEIPVQMIDYHQPANQETESS